MLFRTYTKLKYIHIRMSGIEEECLNDFTWYLFPRWPFQTYLLRGRASICNTVSRGAVTAEWRKMKWINTFSQLTYLHRHLVQRDQAWVMFPLQSVHSRLIALRYEVQLRWYLRVMDPRPLLTWTNLIQLLRKKMLLHPRCLPHHVQWPLSSNYLYFLVYREGRPIGTKICRAPNLLRLDLSRKPGQRVVCSQQ